MVMSPCTEISRTMGDLYECSPINGFVRIRTPYLYPDGDIIDLYLQEKMGQITFTDLGDTLRWLRMQTFARQKTDKQEALIRDICLTLGVEQYRGMLLLRVKQNESLVSAITRLAQAVIRVSDIWFTFRTRALESIQEEVAEFLSELKIPFTQNEKVRGHSGRSRTIDFHTRHSRQSSFVELLSTGSRAAANSKADSTLVTWYDVNYLKMGSNDIQFVSLFDDTLDVWTSNNIQLLEQISDVAYWSRREHFAELVAPHR
jgi:Domain of unknown function DUF1828